MDIAKDEKQGNSKRKRMSRSDENRPRTCGIYKTHIYYNSSSPRCHRTPSINAHKMEFFAQLAIRLYNINEFTDFTQLKVLKAWLLVYGYCDYRIIFQASPPHCDTPSLFVTKVRQYAAQYPTIRIMFVRIKGQLLPSNIHQHTLSQHIKTLSADYLAPCLSQLALLLYDFIRLHANKDPVHDFPSLKLVKLKRHVTDDTTYFLTFDAYLRDKSKNVETFETQICVSTLSRTTLFEFKIIQIKNTTGTGALLAECHCHKKREKTSC